MIVHISMKTKLMKVSWKNLKLSVKIKIKFISPLYFAILLMYMAYIGILIKVALFESIFN